MRDSFVLYTQYYDQIGELTVEQRGILFTAIFAHELDEELPEMDDLTRMCFSFIRDKLDRDAEKYDKICERRKAAADKRWMQVHANAGSALHGDNEHENDNDNDCVNDNERIKRRRNKRPAEQHNYDFKQIEADLLKRQREGLRE